jgi:putative glutamine amidotransferase
MTKKVVGLTYSDVAKIGPYVEALQAAGLEVRPIGAGSGAAIDDLDGLVLSGGIDLNPRLYGEERHPKADEPNDARDETELSLLRKALDRDLPVLAICRGMQLFNVATGGSLDQHIARCDVHQRYDLEKRLPVHTVDVEAGTQLAAILKSGNVHVNSRHHQAVARVGEGLKISARSQDGVVEGIELPGKRFAVGVQWHPEDQASTDPLQARLFGDFAGTVVSSGVRE